MKGIIQPTRGRPSKVTKPVQTPSRARAGLPRRIGGSAEPSLDPNQDPNLEQHDFEVDDILEDDGNEHQHHEQQQEQHHNHHHSDFDPEAAAAAAAAAAAHQQQLDLTAASILSSSVQNPNDQHHHPHAGLDGGHDMKVGEPGPHTTESLANQSGYENVTVESALAKRLAREPGMRLAQQRRPEQQLNLVRRSNVEALFAHIAGEEAGVPCKNCHKGHGPWTTCVIVDGQMCGSCANCWFNASGARCSFHEARNPGHPGHGMGTDNMGFPIPIAPPGATAPFNFASVPASADPVVRYTIEQAMAQIRAADSRNRQILMIEAAARQLAFQICQYEDAAHEEQQQQNQAGQGPPQAVMNAQDAP